MNVLELKQYIIDNNDKIGDILAKLGCTNIKPYGKEYRACSPNFNSNNCNIVVNKETLFSRIYTSSDTKKGDLLSIIMELGNVDFKGALKFSCTSLGLPYIGFNQQIKPIKTNISDIFKNATKSKEIIDVSAIPRTNIDAIEDYMPVLTKEWVNEGICENARRDFNIGYSPSLKRIIIPHYYIDGSIIGIFGRTIIKNYDLYGIPKYLGIKPYPKSTNIFGYSQNYKTIQESGQVWVFEAEKSVLKRYSRLDGRAVACCCHELSSVQVSMLIGLNVDINISMDSDIPLIQTLSLCEKFYATRQVYFTWDSLGLLPSKSSIADLDDKEFKWWESQKILYDDNWHNKYLQMIKGEK